MGEVTVQRHLALRAAPSKHAAQVPPHIHDANLIQGIEYIFG